MADVSSAAASVASSVSASAAPDFLSGLNISWLLTVVIALIVLLLVVRLCFALWRRVRRNSQARSLQQDLMVWTYLKSLLKGGSKADKVKSELNLKLGRINALFAAGIQMLSGKRHLGAYQDWYLLAGEPESGKSSLLQQCGLDFAVSATEEQDKVPLRFWAGSGVVFTEVSGRVFFDAWAGGSGAEFRRIITLLRKRHHKKPLQGIVLCIPADALIADDARMTHKKAALMAEELLRLTRALNMYLPCTVVVTKLDVVLGFREYFAALPSELKDELFGFKTAGGQYEAAQVDAFFENMRRRLSEGACALFDSQAVLGLSFQGQSRLNLTSGMYVFPDNFAALKTNLKQYLSVLFALTDSSLKNYLSLQGCFFTSAQDAGYCLNADFAALCGKSLDEAVFVDPEFRRSRPLFIRQVLSSVVPAMAPQAHFNRAEKLRRQLPAYALCLLLSVCSAVWLWGMAVSAPQLGNRLTDDTLYYRSLAGLWRDQVIAQAPLLAYDQAGRSITLFEEAMPHDSQTTRLNFFAQSQLRLRQRLDTPWQFFPASWLMFGTGSNKFLGQRSFIYNAIQTQMAYLPLVRSVEQSMALKDGPFVLAERDALLSLMDIALFRDEHKAIAYNDVYSISLMQSFLDYLYPELSTNIKAELSLFLPEYDYYSVATNNDIILSQSYISSTGQALQHFRQQWQALANYPESNYQQLRTDVQAALQLSAAWRWLHDLKSRNFALLTEEQTDTLLQDFRQTADRVQADSAELNLLIRQMLQQAQGAAVAGNGKDGAAAPGQLSLLDQAYMAYRKRLQEDYAFLSYFDQSRFENSANQSHIYFGSVDLSHLRAEQNTLQQKLQADFAALKEDFQTLLHSEAFAPAAGQSVAGQDYAMNYQLLSELLQYTLLPAVPEGAAPAAAAAVAEGADSAAGAERRGQVSGQNVLQVLQGSPDAFARDLSVSFAALLQLEETYERQSAALQEYIQDHKDSGTVQEFGQLCASILSLQKQQQEMVLFARILDCYPGERSPAAMQAALSLRLGALPFAVLPGEENIDPEVAAQVLGNFSLREEYNPGAFLQYAEPVVYLTQRAREGKGQESTAGTYLRRNAKLKVLQQALSYYATGFVSYWAQMADALRPQASDFASFHALSDRSRAYEVNAALQQFYALGAAALTATDDSLLSKPARKLKEQGLQRLSQKLSVFGLNFNDTCAQVLTAWSALPYEPVFAGQQVFSQGSTVAGQKSAQAAYSLGSGAVSIPWWDYFCALGKSLLREDALAQGQYSLAVLLHSLQAFPVAKDAERSYSLTLRQLQEGLSGFAVLGLDKLAQAPVATALPGMPQLNGAGAGAGSLPEELVRQPRLRQVIIPEVYDLLKTLTAQDKQGFTLSVVPAAAQQKLHEEVLPELPLTCLRYRYVSVSAAQSKLTGGRRVQSSGGVNLQLYAGKLADSDLRLDFYRYSGDSTPAASVTIPGAYAALSLYLQEDSVFDEASGLSIIPVTVQGEEGPGVYFLRLQTKGKLPSPDKWPVSSDLTLL